MAIEILEDGIRYAAKTKIKNLAFEVAETKNLRKVQDKIDLGAQIYKWCQALDYGDYLSKNTRDTIVRALVDLAGINELPVAPYLGNITPPSILVGLPGDDGEQGETGPEGGGVPFSATSVSIDTICDSFPVADSRGVEYTFNVYDDSGSDMKIIRLQGGWNEDGSVYGDDGGIGQTIQGDCSGISFAINVSGTTVRLFATVTSGTWTVSGTRKYVPNNGNGIVSPTTLASGKIWVGNSSNSPVANTVSGDFTISTTGVGAIASGVIVNADISGTAAIAASKLAAQTASRAIVSDASGFLTTSTATATEVGYLSGVTSAIQTQLDSKIGSASGAISTVVSTNLTADRAVISNPSGKIAVSNVTTTELGYVSGVTSAIQTQINSRVADTGDTMTGALVNTSTIEAQGGIRTASSGSYSKTSIVDIGEWDMDSVAGISVAHGIADFTKIRSISTTIRNDFDNQGYDLLNSGTVRWGATDVTLNRVTSGDFDSSSFNATAASPESLGVGANRGWLLIQHIA